MTWSRNGDGDIIVNTPEGHNIYYTEKGVLIDGGTLDVDDRTGNGPENVYWQSTPPKGTYHVCFVTYSFSPDVSSSDPVIAALVWRIPSSNTIATISKTFTSNTGRSYTCSTSHAGYMKTLTIS
ncbi:unnamed protein product [Didymodactylos carnosus]|uniref:Uncharacterized protein n=1 Tax=Didymodactylos carnosus TaxID=1234261 RepID=A0A814SCG8_9BILA|nr:unnamed protein product [Didymodactylos carnosus]CAF1145370.1 unnamed protein product [Didymodactylos carnosus]CAF3866091.1 unnamed protein product [Didymodactylos carnosus]CAF3909066.1 unnamed protein product [Didymodactylos carnosus]